MLHSAESALSRSQRAKNRQIKARQFQLINGFSAMKCLMRPEACRFQSTVVRAPGPALSVRIGSVEYDAVVY